MSDGPENEYDCSLWQAIKSYSQQREGSVQSGAVLNAPWGSWGDFSDSVK